jgi:HAT1-interacting factor 1
MADVYFAYGKALLENAIAQNSVLGKEKEGAAEPEGNVPHNNKLL